MPQLFRAEALEHYQRGRTDEAHLLEIEPRWMRLTYWLLVGIACGAMVFAWVVKIDRTAKGAGVVRGGALVVLVPARHRAELRENLPLRFDYGEARLRRVERKIIAAAEARRMLGVDGAALWTTNAPAIIAEAPLATNDLGEGVTTSVEIRVARERLLFALIPTLRGRR